MNTITKVALGIVAVIALVGAYMYPTARTVVLGGASPVGSTFGSARIAAINAAPSTLGATSTSILNTDGNSRYITDGFAFCTGIQQASTSVASWNLKAATTTTSSLGLQGSTNYSLNLTVSTSTSVSYQSSTTEGVITGWTRIWPSNTYLTFLFNATDTAACNIGVHYLGS